ncbi:hypothetical protein [Methylobacterium sp. WSM2598]|uniref:hypothetical protein n=1 Tax=Methylobacterium sp. WSM2598 TaxID=398261 RepID=UPI000360348F|nr:hypothetical protein [Methylobacterium sp. WSM2598]
MSGRVGREDIDVEALLVRAYRERQVHRLQTAEGCDRALSRLIGLGTPSTGGGWNVAEPVDTSAYAANMAARSREAWRRIEGTADALLDLHDQVLGLADWFVELTGGAEFLVWDRASAAALGHRIETAAEGDTIVAVRRRGGRGAGREDLVEDGPRRPVSRIVTTALVIRHAQDATRPHVADLVEVGRRPVYQGARKEAVGHAPVYDVAPELVARDRAIWSAWHAALGLIAQGPARPARLRRHRPAGARRAVAPGRAGRAPGPRRPGARARRPAGGPAPAARAAIKRGLGMGKKLA